MKIDVVLSPAELPFLARKDLKDAVCVVFDVLRATSSIVTALANEAECVVPVSEISEALAYRQTNRNCLLAGERHGLRITAEMANGTSFDLGNSPREFSREKVRGKTICMTTTNGTRALRACAGAREILTASFLNLEATRQHLCRSQLERLVIICAGTFEEVAYEDVLAGGALCEAFIKNGVSITLGDAARIARDTFLQRPAPLSEALGLSKNGRRLLAQPSLCDDVAFCAQRDFCPLVAVTSADGAIRRP